MGDNSAEGDPVGQYAYYAPDRHPALHPRKDGSDAAPLTPPQSSHGHDRASNDDVSGKESGAALPADRYRPRTPPVSPQDRYRPRDLPPQQHETHHHDTDRSSANHPPRETEHRHGHDNRHDGASNAQRPPNPGLPRSTTMPHSSQNYSSPLHTSREQKTRVDDERNRNREQRAPRSSRRDASSNSPHRPRRVEPSIHGHHHPDDDEQYDRHQRIRDHGNASKSLTHRAPPADGDHRHHDERSSRSKQSSPTHRSRAEEVLSSALIRPTLTRSRTTSGHNRRPLSQVLDDPRVSHAAAAAFRAGATAAVGMAGTGGWSNEKGAKIIQAALGAAAMEAVAEMRGGGNGQHAGGGASEKKNAPKDHGHVTKESAPAQKAGNPVGEALGALLAEQLAKRRAKH